MSSTPYNTNTQQQVYSNTMPTNSSAAARNRSSGIAQQQPVSKPMTSTAYGNFGMSNNALG